MRRTSFLSLIAMFVVGAGIARSDSITFSGDGPNGHYTGSASYTFAGGTGDLTIQITNTSAAAGPSITSFAFNSVDALSVVLTSPTPAFSNLAGFDASPYGTFAFGAATTALPIVSGATATFDFAVTGASAGSAGVLNFFSKVGTGATSPSSPLVARFSNGELVPDSVDPVPLPPVAWGGIALLAAFGFRQYFGATRIAV